jgi:hypothetical protein
MISTLTTTSKVIAMTTCKKCLITAIVAASIVTGIYEVRRAHALKSENNPLRQLPPTLKNWSEVDPLALQHERDGALEGMQILKEENAGLKKQLTELPGLRAEVARMRKDLKELAANPPAGSDPFLQKALKWKANESRLRQIFEERPDQRIPEMAKLSDGEWLDLAKGANLETEEGVRHALSDMRKYARNMFIDKVSDALRRYVAENNGRLPGDVMQLKPFFDSPVADDVLGEYRMRYTGRVEDVPRADWAMTDRVVDGELDTQWGVGPGSYGILPQAPERIQALMSQLDPAIKAFSAANNGRNPAGLGELKPYLTPTAREAFEQLDRLGVGVGFSGTAARK